MMQLTAEDLRTAVAGQWIGVDPCRARVPRIDGGAGSAESGAGAATHLSFQVPLIYQGVGTDTREDLRGRLFIALRGDRFDAHQFLAAALERGAAGALVDRKAGTYERPAGLPLLEVADTRVALADLARFWRSRLRGKVIAVTGSSGKTTTRRLIDAALRTQMSGSASPKSYNNDIGVPLTLLGAASDDGYVVVEIGMNHPGEIAPLARIAAPHVALITMAGRAHLAGMGSVEAIIAEKATLVDGLSTNGMVFVNGDQPALVAAVLARVKPGVRVVPFGTGTGAGACAGAGAAACQWRLVGRTAQGETQTLRIAEPDGTQWDCPLGLPGDYNGMNALASIGVARALGVPAANIATAFAAIRPTEMRMVRQQLGDVAVYNDAYNANPDAVLASLRAFVEVAANAPRRVTVLGDMLELGDPATVAELHAEVGRAVAASAPHVAVFVGEGSAHGAAAARNALDALQELDSPDSNAAPRAPGTAAGAPGRATRLPTTTHVLHIAQLDDAGIATIARHLQPHDAVLLKGSRGSRMERLVSALEARPPTRRPPPSCSTT